MLWVACKNPFAQDFDRNKMEKAFDKLEMVVCVDQFFNETVQHADIVLPVTTTFEHWSVFVLLALLADGKRTCHQADVRMQKRPGYCRVALRTINKMEPGSCTFPQDVDQKKWLDLEFNDGLAKRLASAPGTIC
jgi:hypothetical protein